MRLKIHWKYGEQTGFFSDDWNGSFNGAYYYYKEGNMSCDCNLCAAIGLGKDWPCGDSIKVDWIEEVKL